MSSQAVCSLVPQIQFGDATTNERSIADAVALRPTSTVFDDDANDDNDTATKLVRTPLRQHSVRLCGLSVCACLRSDRSRRTTSRQRRLRRRRLPPSTTRSFRFSLSRFSMFRSVLRIVILFDDGLDWQNDDYAGAEVHDVGS